MRTTRIRIPKRRAFTLIELVTVMTIIGLIGVAVVGVTLSYVDLIRARGAAARLSCDIRYAQRVALASRLRTWVTFDSANNQYQLYVENSSNLGKANRQTLTSPLMQSSGATQFGSSPFTNVSIQSTNINSTSEIEFDSFGAPYDGNSTAITANGTITLSNGVTITVRPVSGFVDRAG